MSRRGQHARETYTYEPATISTGSGDGGSDNDDELPPLPPPPPPKVMLPVPLTSSSQRGPPLILGRGRGKEILLTRFAPPPIIVKSVPRALNFAPKKQ